MIKIAFILGVILIMGCSSKEVYVCVSPTAHAYHVDKECKGLSKCTHMVVEMPKEEAKEQHRTPCHYCH